MNGYSLVEFFNKIKKEKLLANSMILFFGSFAVGSTNYIYQFLMARMLTVSAYGELQSLLAILSIIGVLAGTISMVLMKYTADFKAKDQLNKVYSMFLFFAKKISISAIIFFVIFIILSPYIAEFLKLTSVFPLMILGAAFLFSLPNSINSGILQGLQKFKEISAISVISSLLKLSAAFLLVQWGFAISGAVGAVVLASFIGYLLSFSQIKFLFKKQKEEIHTKEILRYSFPVFFSLLFTILLFNIDIILVKHFFSAQTAGEYGALAMLGRMIFFLTAPVGVAMFPMSADAHSSSNSSGKILKKAIILTIFVGLAVVFFYFIFADLIITILIGTKFLIIGKFLGWFAFSMFLYSLVAVFSSYFLSVGKVRGAYLLGAGALLQVTLISIFHTNLWQIIWVMNGSMLFTLSLLIFYWLMFKKNL